MISIVANLWQRLFPNEIIDLSHIVWESEEDVSEDSEGYVVDDHGDTTIRHSLNLYK